MSSYKELLAQRENLERQIEEAKSREYAEVLNEIKQKMADYGITLAELAGGRSGKNLKTQRASARGRSPEVSRSGKRQHVVGPRQAAEVDRRSGTRQLPDPEVRAGHLEKAAPLKARLFLCVYARAVFGRTCRPCASVRYSSTTENASRFFKSDDF